VIAHTSSFQPVKLATFAVCGWAASPAVTADICKYSDMKEDEVHGFILELAKKHLPRVHTTKSPSSLESGATPAAHTKETAHSKNFTDTATTNNPGPDPASGMMVTTTTGTTATATQASTATQVSSTSSLSTTGTGTGQPGQSKKPVNRYSKEYREEQCRLKWQENKDSDEDKALL
jgi:hypothetical protein